MAASAASISPTGMNGPSATYHRKLIS